MVTDLTLKVGLISIIYASIKLSYSGNVLIIALCAVKTFSKFVCVNVTSSEKI